MAAIQSLNDTSINMVVNTGVDVSGNPVLKTRKYSNVKTNVNAQSIYDTVVALASLQIHPIESIIRQDDSLIENL